MEQQHLTQAENAVLMWSISVSAARNQQIISYAAIEGFTGIDRIGQNQALGLIQSYCKRRSWPFLNCLVVSQVTGLPAEEFREKMDPVQILTEQAKVFVFDWAGHDKPRPQDLQTESQ
jgi:hypothetical protein